MLGILNCALYSILYTLYAILNTHYSVLSAEDARIIGGRGGAVSGVEVGSGVRESWVRPTDCNGLDVRGCGCDMGQLRTSGTIDGSIDSSQRETSEVRVCFAWIR